MKRLFAAIMALFVMATGDGYTVFLPSITRTFCQQPPLNEETMSDWKLVIPQATRNIVLNPSGEIAGNFGTAGAATNSRSTTESLYGAYSYNVTGNGLADNYTYTTGAQAASTYYITIRINGTPPNAPQVSLDSLNYTTMENLGTINGDWTLYGATETGSVVSTLVWFRHPSGAFDYYVDGIQVELGSEYTTYCDGDREGCEWAGVAHSSISIRSALTRAGGTVEDFTDDYNFHITQVIGAGKSRLAISTDPYALLPGSQLNNIKTTERTWALSGQIRDDDNDCNITDERQALIDALSHDAYPATEEGWQPVRIRYEGASDGVIKEIEAHYETGLELNWNANMPVREVTALRFLSPDPFWYGLGEESEPLDTVDTDTLRYIAGRLRSSGQWEDLNLFGGDPTGGGDVLAIMYNPNDNKVYVGGDFTGWNGTAGWDYGVIYDIESDGWERWGGASEINDVVRAIALGPDGTIYVGGDFTNLGGANGDYFSSYTGGAFADVSGGGTLGVNALAVGLDGTVYIGGYFTNWNAIANADYIVSWDGVAYAALSTGASDLIRALAVGLNGEIYAGGDYGTIGGVASVGISYWDGSNWNDMAGGISGGVGDGVHGIGVDSRGFVYIGGTFSTAGGNSATNAAVWNGTTFKALGDGISGDVRSVRVSPDDDAFFGGAKAFNSFTPRFVRWNGDAFVPPDVELPGAAVVRAIEFGPPDPTVSANYDWYVGYDTTGAGTFSGITTVTNDGTARAYPRIEYTNENAGATVTLVSIRNETTGRQLWFDYDVLDGEKITIDTTPQIQSFVSSFFGSRPDAAIKGSDFANFELLPGDNDITIFIEDSDTADIAPLIWRVTYKSFD